MDHDPPADDAGAYLQLMPRFPTGAGSARWHVFQVSAEPPRITRVGSVSSFTEARALAAKHKRPLRIAAQAWRQMLDARVAPKTVPDDVTLT